MLCQYANGFGAVAATALMADNGSQAAGFDSDEQFNPLAARPPHFSPRAKNVIFLYMDGGPSQVDTFDPKPRLSREDGKPFSMNVDQTTLQFDNMGKTLASPWKFQQHGQSGIDVSELFPHVAGCVDDMAVIRSMTAKFSEHTFANYFLHTGHPIQGRPSMGAWVTYGLGSLCSNLPGFIVLNGGLTPPGGLDNFNSGYLPATFQASVFTAGNMPVANIKPLERTVQLQQNKLALLRRLDRRAADQRDNPDNLEAAIASYEVAARMQTAVPELMDLTGETQQTRRMYGLEDDFRNTQTYGHICLVARRMIERGVRFIELTCPSGNGDRWDQHSNLRDGHSKNARSVDKPIAALLQDLKQRGLLDETLVVFAGEFGRTPFAQGRDGRDHNRFGFSVWLAGGGVKGGTVYGATDEYGYKAVEGRVEIHDLHATMLHLLGVDHTRQTFRFGGRDMRLTDVHGSVIDEVVG
ncbi:MAG: DUF1501 domain-containing protein [Fuerstiella sp.]|nr:DUF1501 domain-containing protein [Fuerstiella sp.]MCP4784452.1 DUF1501 domain-containing protein [Fuerstiella sp.]MCP4859425.1 DUF1501 domain-containing protein [Fuerstiella sp.]